MPIEESIRHLGPWFHNLHLPGGVQTAPEHFLGDFPNLKWKQLEPHLPKNLAGWKVLDVGCNAGFYSFELAKRGAQVLGIDSDEHYLRQARWIAQEFHPSNPPTFWQMQVQELARLDENFDLILFMGVFYHLRYPTLALDTIAAKTRKLMVFQTLTMNGDQVVSAKPDYPIMEREIFDEPGWPKMAFIEGKFSNDETNWWVPNHSAVLSMLRSTGFEQIDRVAHEIYLCRPPEGGIRRNRTWDEAEWTAATGAYPSPQPSDGGLAS